MQIIKLLTDLRNRLNIDRNMNENQIAMCASDIVDSNEFYMLRVEDFELCFKNACAGQYGEFYGRLDQPMVFGFIRKYSIERDAAIARKRDSESDRSNIYDIFQTETMKRIMTDVNDKLAIKEAKPVSEPPSEDGPFAAKRAILNVLMDEFDNLRKEQGAISFVDYYGKKLDVTGYMQVRVLEMTEENQNPQ